MSTKRSRVIGIAVAGTLSLAAAVSVAAATPPSGVGAAPVGAANAYLTMVNGHQDAASATLAGAEQAPAAQSDTMTEGQRVLQFDRVRFVRGERQLAAARATAAKAAVAKAAAAKAAAAKATARQTVVQSAPAPQSTQAPSVAAQQPALAASGAPEQVAEQMLSQFGWSGSEFSCLEPLWERESGWDVTAENPSSGAYGIAQALPGAAMASAGSDWQTDAATQIRWGLTYIQGRYGSPCGAWAHEEADGWY